jgi:hypothetical protein
MKKCHVCSEPLDIRLMPDFSSSGMWCASCGVCFANPKETFPFIPAGLIDLIEGWNELWDLASMHSQEIGINAFDEIIQNMGNELARQLSKYCDCRFDEKASKIYPLKEEG